MKWWGLRVERSGTLSLKVSGLVDFWFAADNLCTTGNIASNPPGAENRRILTTYSAERKEALQRRMMAPENKPAAELARETGIAYQTLYTWRRQLKTQGIAVPGNGKNSEQWSSEDKFAVVLETATMSMADQAE